MQKKLALAGMLIAAASLQAQSSDVRINQIQVIGSHNSYHEGLTPGVKAILAAKNPKALRSLDYSHQTLDKQFDGGVRQIEIDVFSDSKGGLYAHPASDKILADMHLPPDAGYNADGVMNKPGFKVMHIQDLDQHSSCNPFIQCLQQIRHWSQAHPQHVPIFVLVEGKYGKSKEMPNGVTPEDFTPAVFDALDAEIRSVFKPSELITPDEVRGSHATLPEAVGHDGWPLLSKSRGKVIFLLDNRKLTPVYIEGHTALKGRVLFTNSVPGDPDAAFTEQNDGSQETIDGLVKQGYLVRARTDEGTEQARTNNTARRDEVLRSGAQLVSTDYPSTEPAQFPGGYFVSLPNKAVVRCNSVSAPKGCDLSKIAKP